jgi:hypothetical protein
VTLDEVREEVHAVDAGLAEGAPDLRLETDEDVAGLLAFFSADRSRRVVRVVIEGDAAGYLERGDVLAWFQTRSMGLGDGDRASLMGKVPPRRWRFHELECPVPDCPEPPQVVVKFDPAHAPHCATHTDRELRLRQ